MKNLLLCISVLMYFFVFPQEKYESKIYNGETGFTNTLNDMVQDEDKMLWLSTEDGLWKFDGYNFVRILNRYEKETGKSAQKSIPHQGLVYTLFSGKGCLSYDTQTGEEQLITTSEVFDFFIEGSRIFFLLKNLDVLILSDGKKQTYKTGLKHTFSGLKRAGIMVKRGVIYLSIPELGFYRIEGGKLIPYEKRKGGIRPSGVFGERFKMYGDEIYFSGLKHPLLIKKDSIVNKAPKGMVYHRINDFEKVRERVYFIKDSKSVYLEQGVQRYELILNLENVEFRKLLVDGQHLYIATNQGLIDIVKKQNYLKNLNDDAYGNRFKVRRKIISSDEGLYLFSNPNVLWYGKDHQLKKIASPALSVYDAAKVEGGFLLGTERRGLLVSNDNFTKISTLLASDDSNPVCTVTYEPYSNRIYAGDYHHLHIVNGYGKPRQSIIKIPNLFDGKMIKAVVKDELNDRILVGTDGGLFVVNAKNMKYVKFSIRNRIIGDILIDRGQKIAYVGDDKGLTVVRLKDLKILRKISFDFMNSGRVTALLQDDVGKVWASTYSGIVGYDYGRDLLVNLRKKNGLINTEYNYKASAKLKDGQLIFGGLNGYDLLEPRKINFRLNEEEGKVSGYHLIGKDSIYRKIKKNQTISYRGDHHYSRIYLSIPGTYNRAQCTFDYKINEGTWSSLKDRYYIDLIGLSAGNYEISIRGYDELGKLISFAPLKIKVKESFYESNYFILGSLLLIFSLIIWVFYLANRNLNIKNDIYERVSMDLHDEVGTVLSKTSLILQYVKSIDEEQKNKIVDHINHANFSLRAYINNSKHKEVAIIDLYDDCKEFMTDTLSLKTIELAFIQNGDEQVKIGSELSRDVTMCMYEITNNIIKHSQSYKIDVYFSWTHQLLSIQIEEHGGELSFDQDSAGHGIKNLQKRVLRNKGEIKIKNDLQQRRMVISIQFKI